MFSFTQYGTISGRIEKISTDVIDDRRLRAVHTARIILLRGMIPTADGEKTASARHAAVATRRSTLCATPKAVPNIIERMFCRLRDWRRVAMRFDRNIKTFMAFMATIAIAATVIWWL